MYFYLFFILLTRKNLKNTLRGRLPHIQFQGTKYNYDICAKKTYHAHKNKQQSGNKMLNLTVLSMILLSVFLSAFAQIFLKLGMSNFEVQQALSSTSILVISKSIATSHYVIAGLALYFASAAVWLFVLARIEVSIAYPFVGLGFIVTMLLAFLINGEPLSVTKIVGTLCIALGVAIVAQA